MTNRFAVCDEFTAAPAANRSAAAQPCLQVRSPDPQPQDVRQDALDHVHSRSGAVFPMIADALAP